MKKEMTISELSEKLDKKFSGIDGRLDGIDARLEAVGKTCYETQEIAQELLVRRDDHEYRISSLERGQARLRMLIDR